MSENLEVVQEAEEFLIVKLYANTLYDEDGNPYYGDIYLSLADATKEHPDSEILTGYGVCETISGYSVEDSDDWYYTVEEAMEYIEFMKKF